jgi:phage gp37-like protein
LFSEASADASTRFYYEIANPPEAVSNQLGGKMQSFMKYNTIPLDLSYIRKDVIVLPSSWVRTLGPVAFERRHEEGDHFAAYEKAALLVDDSRRTVQTSKCWCLTVASELNLAQGHDLFIRGSYTLH